MGCASSKPSSTSKKNKKDNSSSSSTKQKLNQNNKKQSSSQNNINDSNSLKQNRTTNDENDFNKTTLTHTLPQHKEFQNQKTPTSPHNEILNEHIKVDRNLLDQIELNKNEVIDYIVGIVRKQLNHELLTNGSLNLTNSFKSKDAKNKPVANFANLAVAVATQQENDDLITDVAAKAILLIKTGVCSTTYADLSDKLKSSQFLNKNQTHKNRICDLTVETIRNCLNEINAKYSRDGSFNLLEHILDSQNEDDNRIADNSNNLNSNPNQLTPPLTPPQTPENKNRYNEDNEDPESVVLLTRTDAMTLSRLMFLSPDKYDRPVMRSSKKRTDYFYVNKQLSKDNSEVILTRDEVEQILNSRNNNFINNLTPTHYTSTNYSIQTSSNYNNNNNNNDNSNHINHYETSTNQFFNNNINNNINNLNDLVNNTTPKATTVITTPSHLNQLTPIFDDSFKPQKRQTITELNQELSRAILTSVNLESNGNNDHLNNSNVLSENRIDNDINTNNPNEIEQNSKLNDELNQGNGDNSENSNLNSNNDEELNKLVMNTISLLANKQSDNGTMDPILNQTLLDDRFYNNDSFKNGPPVNDRNQDFAATVIQSGFKGHTVRQEIANGTSNGNHQNSEGQHHQEIEKVEEKVEEIVDSIVENNLVSEINNQDNNPDPIEDEKVKAAATTIQATFRGYKTRKELNPSIKQNKSRPLSADQEKETIQSFTTVETIQTDSVPLNDEITNTSPTSYSDLNKSDLVNNNNLENDLNKLEELDSNNTSTKNIDQAAIKIQSTYRGFRTRKELELKKEKKQKPKTNNNNNNQKNNKNNSNNTTNSISSNTTTANNNNSSIINEISKATLLVETNLNKIKQEEEREIEIPREQVDNSNTTTSSNDNNSSNNASNIITDEQIENLISSLHTSSNSTNSNKNNIDININDNKTNTILNNSNSGLIEAAIEQEKEEENKLNLSIDKSDIKEEEKEIENSLIKQHMDLNETLRKNIEKENLEENIQNTLQENSNINRTQETNVSLHDSSLTQQQTDSQDNRQNNNKNNNLNQIQIDNKMLSDNNNNNNSNNTNQNIELDKAATKIQSTFRGYKTRKNFKKPSNNQNDSKKEDKQQAKENNENEQQQQQQQLKQQDLEQTTNKTSKKRLLNNSNSNHQMSDAKRASLHDPQIAATKIQSTFRGYKTRKNLENKKRAKYSVKSNEQKNLNDKVENQENNLNSALGDDKRANANTGNNEDNEEQEVY